MKICDVEIKIEGRYLRIAYLDADRYKFIEDPESMVEGLRKSGRRIDLFTFTQRLTDTTPKYPYPMEWDNLAVLPVTTFEHWWTKQINSGPRGRVRMAEKKGVITREVSFDDELARGIWAIYNECPIRQGRRFPHYGKDLQTVRREAETYMDSSQFIGAYLDGNLIGFIKLVWDETRTQAGFMNIISMIRHRDKAPTNALVAHAVRFCASQKIPYLVYLNFVYGNKKRDSLTDFKKRNGFQRVDVPRCYVPLSGLGSLALRMGFHRRWVDRLPASFAEKLREVRNAWNNRRFPAVHETS